MSLEQDLKDFDIDKRIDDPEVFWEGAYSLYERTSKPTPMPKDLAIKAVKENIIQAIIKSLDDTANYLQRGIATGDFLYKYLSTMFTVNDSVKDMLDSCYGENTAWKGIEEFGSRTAAKLYFTKVAHDFVLETIIPVLQKKGYRCDQMGLMMPGDESISTAFTLTIPMKGERFHDDEDRKHESE